VSSFVGRQRELTDLMRLVKSTRLLTLAGAGGVGKTRLALRVAAALIEFHPDGVWYVELAALGEPALVPQAVAVVLGVDERPSVPTQHLLARALAGRTLLVIDNCEHLIDACARFISELLQACPALRVIATSRQPLGIGGEQTWRVPSLSLPDAPDTVERVGRSEAARLFLERARAAEPELVLGESNAEDVAAICRRLGGIPLALELAAARVPLLSPAQILTRLDNRFQLLVGGRTRWPRHKTLLATLDWSHGLLDDAEQHLFRRLAVFSGGWTLEAAEAICADGELRSEDALDLLGRLIDKSLVSAETVSDTARRYRFLETVRAYAEARLLEALKRPRFKRAMLCTSPPWRRRPSPTCA